MRLMDKPVVRSMLRDLMGTGMDTVDCARVLLGLPSYEAKVWNGLAATDAVIHNEEKSIG